MSTRAIREVLDAFAATMSEQEKETHRSALAEVESIEKDLRETAEARDAAVQKVVSLRRQLKGHEEEEEPKT